MACAQRCCPRSRPPATGRASWPPVRADDRGMSTSVQVVWDDALAAYDFGPSHPLAPIRVVLTMSLAQSLGVLSLPNVTMTGTTAATDDLLRLVDQSPYIHAGRRAGPPPPRSDAPPGPRTPGRPGRAR